MNTQHIVTLEIGRQHADQVMEKIESSWGHPVIQLERPGHAFVWLELYIEQPAEAEIIRMVAAGWPEVRAAAVRTENPRDWKTFWRHHFHATNVGDHLRIVPVWEEASAYESGDRKVIWLDPGLSFGTGDHFTTRFCLEMIDRLVPAGGIDSMLDVGTGSSILAIAAHILGVSRIIGIDHDAYALDQARENLKLNAIATGVELKVSDITEAPVEGAFDLVCANVYTSVLLSIAGPLVDCTGRYLVLSGIRDPELDEVGRVYREYGMAEIFRDGNGEWGGLAFEKTGGT